MQLSLSSVPADSGATSLLNGLPGSSGGAANDTAAAAPGAFDAFAQVLAGCDAPGSAPAMPPGVVVPGAAIPAAGAVFNFADPRFAPPVVAVDPAVSGQVVPLPPQPVATGGAPAANGPTSDKTTLPSGSRAKDLTALGDLQALAALLVPTPTPPADPTMSPAGSAPDQVAAAPVEADTAAVDPGAWGRPSPDLRPIPFRSPAPSAPTIAGAQADVAAFDPGAADPTAVVPNRATPAPAAPDSMPAPAAAVPAQATVASAPGTPDIAAAPLPADAGATPNDAATAARDGGPAQVLAPMQGMEKIAGAAMEGARRDERQGIKVDAKSFVASERKALTRFNPGLGIGTAEPAATMPAGATPDRKTSSDPVVPTTAPVSEARSDATLPAPVALTSTAHRAVEAALATADRFAARDQHAVTLQFSVGGSDLNVRVELRAGEVHTTFRTDSAELRAALSSEWQAVTNQSPADRPVRMAAPVFTAAQDSGASFSGDGAARHQQQQDSSNAGSSFPGSASFRSSSRATGSITSAAATTATPARAAAANSVHLHTLA